MFTSERIGFLGGRGIKGRRRVGEQLGPNAQLAQPMRGDRARQAQMR